MTEYEKTVHAMTEAIQLARLEGRDHLTQLIDIGDKLDEFTGTHSDDDIALLRKVLDLTRKLNEEPDEPWRQSLTND
jgi:hypothetical protein